MKLSFGEKKFIIMVLGLILFSPSSIARAGGGESESLRLENAVFEQLTAGAGPGPDGGHVEGGGLKRSGSGAAELTAVSLTGNRALLESAEAVDLGAAGGGASLSGYQSLTVSGGRISGNLASARLGALAHGGGLNLSQISRGALSGLTFLRNTVKVDGTGHSPGLAGHVPSAGARGGALSVSNQGLAEPVFMPAGLAALSVSDSAFLENSAEADGRATAAVGGAVAVIGHIDAVFDGSALAGPMFSGNKALAGPTSGGGAEGGAVAVIGSPFRPLAGDWPPTAVFKQVLFDGNAAVSRTVNNDSLDARGGAVSLQALSGKVFFRDCVFSGNRLETAVAESAKGRGRARGAAVFSDNGLLIENSTFKNNSGRSPGGALGGALELGGTRSLIKNSLFEANTAQGGSVALGPKYRGPVAGFGGAVYLNGQLTVAESIFSGNQAAGLTAQGGAIFVGPKARLTLLNSNLIGNRALGPEAGGGAVAVAAGGRLLIGVTEGRTMTIAGNQAGPSPEKAVASGLFLLPPPAGQPGAEAPAPGDRPPRPEPADLVVNTGREAHLLLRDPVQGEKAEIAKDGPGLLSLAGDNLAAAWEIQAGSLALLADGQGRGAVLRAGGALTFAEATALILEPVAESPHIIDAGQLKLPADLKVAAADDRRPLKKAVILKLTGGCDFKSLSGQSRGGTLTVGETAYDYRLLWNDQGELLFEPVKILPE
jgi:hypothetical protein